MPSRNLKDEKVVSAVLTVLTQTFINPFSDIPLVSISTDIESTKEVAKYLLTAHKIRKDEMTKFTKERLNGGSRMSLFDPIKKRKLATFKSMSKVKSCESKNYHITHCSKRSILQNSFDFTETSDGLKPPRALAEADGTLKNHRSMPFYTNLKLT